MATPRAASAFVCLLGALSTVTGECQPGRFGYNCHLDCNCAGTCNNVTGVCSGACNTGFYESTCQKQNVALGKATHASSEYGSGWTPDKAVDGDTRQVPRQAGSTYFCFHSAAKQTSNWWSVDLGAVFPMKHIVIYYRRDFIRRFNGATVNIANATGPERTCTTITNTYQYTDAIVTLTCPDSGQKLILRQSPNCVECLLEPCEVQVLVCSDGTYGTDCSSQCGRCASGLECHPTSGFCPRGCLPGWRGDNCDQACFNGTYGQNCSLSCGHCSDGANCHHVDGSCPSGTCQPGYRGIKCIQVIPPSSSTGVLVGGMLAALFLLLGIAGVLIVLLARRRGGVKTFITHCTKCDNMKMNTDRDRSFPRAAFSRRRGSARSVDTEASADMGESLEGVYCPVGLPGRAEASSPSCIPAPQLANVVADKRATDAFATEYESVSNKFLAVYDVSQEKVHSKKNKFRGYYPYDFNRVELKPTPSDPQSHYINASHIDGFEKYKAFIAAQAPTPHTLSDFVRMLWQKQCSHVTMLTSLVEEGKVKCIRYWPESEGAELKCGQVTVTLRQQTEWSYCTLRQLRLTHESGETRTVKQFHFTTWPDHGVPSHVDMLDFFWKVRASWSPDSGPLLVHCSAGVGRTGTFIALCILSDQAASQHRVDPLATLTALRHQRRNMIQTLSQYEFLHEALVRVVQLGRTAMNKEDFCSGYAGQGGGLLVGNRTLDQLAQDIPEYSSEINMSKPDDSHIYSNTSWDYFSNTSFLSSARLKRGCLLVRLWDSGTETLAPPGLWHFLLETQACLLLDVHRGQTPQGAGEGKEGVIALQWQAPSPLAPGLITRQVALKRKGRSEVTVEYIALDMAIAETPGYATSVASRLTSVQLASGLPIAYLYRPGEEDLVQLMCAAVNLAETLRLDGHVELVSSLLRLHASVSPTLVSSLADVALASLQEEKSVYANA